MTLVRGVVLTLVLALAAVVQSALVGTISYDGISADLVLIVVVAVALVRGPEFGTVVGFAGGLMLDLVPPADHLAGRWALALAVVGFLAGRLGQDARTPFRAIIAVGAASFVGTSVYAFTGLITHQGPESISSLLGVIVIGMIFDVVAAVLLLRPLLALFRRLRPAQVAI